MKITFRSHREKMILGTLFAFPLGALVIFLYIALNAALTGWIQCLAFNEFGEAWIDVLFLIIGITFILYLIVMVKYSGIERA